MFVGKAKISRAEEDAEIAALTQFYNATGGPQWALHTNWLSDKPVSQWYGIEVNKMGYVLKLKLINNNLTNNIPEDCLGALRCLEKIKLFDNPNLRGNLPKDISTLPLEYIKLDVKSFGLPETWGDMTGKAQSVWIRDNAVEPVVVRNYMVMSRMPAVAMAWINAWSDFDQKVLSEHSIGSLVYKSSSPGKPSVSVDGIDKVWEHRISLSNKPFGTSTTLSSWDLRRDGVLDGVLKLINPLTGSPVTIKNVSFNFDPKCRQVSHVTFVTVFSTTDEELAEIDRKVAAKKQALALKRAEDENRAALVRKAAEESAKITDPGVSSKHALGRKGKDGVATAEDAAHQQKPADKRGKLTKKARGFPYNWKDRHFHLSDASLLYYEGDGGDARSANLKGSIESLKNYTIQVVDRKTFVFAARNDKASDAHNRELIMRSDSNAEFESWVEALQKHIAYANLSK